MTDTCPRCLRRDIPPAVTRRRNGQILHAYRCPCGHQWATARLTSAYPATTKDAA